ncbi:MAG: hypothetical protein LBD53_08755, partial [Tannerella sp.]|nr:hypothetical protein [Tannerella sp.]
MDNKTKERLKELEETYRNASKELSKNLRSYCLGGVGIIWMLQEQLDLQKWSHNAIWSLIFFGLMFASDILQYLIN